MEKIIKVYEDYQTKIKAYNYALWLLGWDLETELPKKGLEYRNNQVKVLNQELYNIMTNEEYLKAVDDLIANKDKLDELMQIEMTHLEKSLRLIKKMPKDEYLAYINLLNESSSIWAEAKENDNLDLF